MHLDSLKIKSLPGIDEPFTVESLCPTVNVLCGPNGIGKTSICRAIRRTLWNDGDQETILDAIWRRDGIAHVARVRLGQTTWQVDDGHDLPRLPDEHLSGCYTLTMEELIQAGSQDHAIAREIDRQLAGGFDIRTVRDRFGSKPEGHRGAANTVKSSRQCLEAAMAEQAELETNERLLTSLEQEAKAARRAQVLVDKIDAAATPMQKAIANLQSVNARLDTTFPEGIEKITGREIDEIEQIRSELDGAEERRRNAELDKEEAEQQKSDARFPNGAPTDLPLTNADSIVDKIQESTSAIDRLERGLTERRATLRDRSSFLGDPDKLQDYGQLSRDDLDDLDTFLRTAQAVEISQASVKAIEPLLTIDDETRNRSGLEEGIGYLRSWLSEPDTDRDNHASLPWWFWVMIAIVVLLIVGLASLHSWWWALLLIVPVAVTGLAVVGQRPSVDDPRPFLERQYQEAALPNVTWTRDEVRSTLRALEEQLARCLLNEKLADRRTQLDQQRAELVELEQKTNEMRMSLADRFPGFAMHSDLTFTEVAKSVHLYMEAYATVQKDQDGLGRYLQMLADDLSRFNEQVGTYLDKPVISADSSRNALQDIKGRCVQWQAGDKTLFRCNRLIQDENNTIKKLDQRIQDVFEQIDLTLEQEEQLRHLVETHEQYQQLASERRELTISIQTYNGQLTDFPELCDLNEEKLAARREQLSDQADSYSVLKEKIGDIRGKLTAAQKSSNMEQAEAELDDAHRALAEKRDEALRSTAGLFLLDRTRKEVNRDVRNGALARAGDLFAKLTHHRYDLVVDHDAEDDSATFVAIDHQDNDRRVPPKELSTGTRMQLIIAARLGFVLDLEQGGEPLPLVLDDALTNSDPQRFAEATHTLVELARDGRQIIYLTLEPEHGRRWVECADALGVESREIDLSKQRHQPVQSADALQIQPPPTRTTPKPEEMDASAYATLTGVPAFDPLAASGSTHPFYLLFDNLNLLYEILQLRMTSLGPLLHMFERQADRSGIRAESRKLVLDRVNILNRFCEGWRVGRGRPYNAADLTDVESVKVSPTFKDRFMRFGAEIGFDAARLVSAIRGKEHQDLKGFRTRVDQLEAHFEDLGVIDSRDPLDQDQMSAFVIARLDMEGKDPDAVNRVIDFLWQVAAYSSSDGGEAGRRPGS